MDVKKKEDCKLEGEDEKTLTPRDLIWAAFQKVLGSVCMRIARTQVSKDKNIGEWLSQRYTDPKALSSAIDKIVYGRTNPPEMTGSPSIISLTPTGSMNEMFVGLHQLDYTKDAKHGCYLAETTLNSLEAAAEISPTWPPCSITSRTLSTTTLMHLENR